MKVTVIQHSLLGTMPRNDPVNLSCNTLQRRSIKILITVRTTAFTE